MSCSCLERRGEAPFDFYPYNPSKIGGWVFLILFGIVSVTHITQVFWHRSWFFIVFFLGCAGETGGYYARQWAHNNIRLSDPYLMQLFLLIGAVPLLSASVYMTLPRFVRALDAAEYVPMRTSWISKIYILIDIACFALQIMGTVTLAYGDGAQQENAVYYIAGGLIFQLLAFLFFIFMAVGVERGLKGEVVGKVVSCGLGKKWRKYFWVLYAVSALIILRNAVRIVEFLQGTDGTIASNEAYLYVFDAAPIFLVVLVLAVLHPGRLLKAANRSGGEGGGSEDGMAIPLTREE
ncbi:hypothetical protein KC363_g4277 [Hortaea werneckii]|nr:hypothetical protein KC325_g6042 [Hortaea werneckii]KAI7000913.1 hypothetical protein KC359_g976 [Hortaea werneckii]KAI7087488.1 hypothetical protein KC356_g4122 [Hortaea werneckii]KAI7143831.1 hypothetical protein KC344_g5932 [Hortaea werneckii]KAI7170611.1 hypothetical protein KC360_g6687 [Hortaea werneckii]